MMMKCGVPVSTSPQMRETPRIPDSGVFKVYIIECFSGFMAFICSFAALSPPPGYCRAAGEGQGSSSVLVINEVYYDHPGSDTGWEYVELFNRSDSTIDLSGYVLEFVDGRTGRSRELWVATPWAVIHPGECLLIGACNRTDSPEYMLAGSLENGPDAVRLLFSSSLVDLVGYGELDIADLYESEPAPDVEPGNSLSRRPDGHDSDNNRADIVLSSPTPGARNFYGTDLSLCIDIDPRLPCRGSSVVVELAVSNDGLYPFRGEVDIEVSISAGCDLCESGNTVSNVELDPGGKDSFSVSLATPSWPDIVVITGAMNAGGDVNSSNDTSKVSAWLSPGRVLINEIMYRPWTGCSEWIEIFNKDSDSIDICNWSIADAVGSRRRITESKSLLGPGDYLILAQDPVTFRADHPSCTAVVYGVQGGWPALNDSGEGVADRIEIVDSGGVVAECVWYRDMLGDERGRSIERYSPTACSSEPGGIWHRCSSDDGSTPGRINSSRSTGSTSVKGVTAFPNPFRPGGDSSVEITFSLDRGESGALVRIFDLNGYEVRRLFGEEGGARRFSCRWDGCREGSAVVSAGLYICLVEFIGQGGGVCRREKCCIAVASGMGLGF